MEFLSIVTRANPGLLFSNTVLGHAEPNDFCSCSDISQQRHSEVKGV